MSEKDIIRVGNKREKDLAHFTSQTRNVHRLFRFNYLHVYMWIKIIIYYIFDLSDSRSLDSRTLARYILAFSLEVTSIARKHSQLSLRKII